MVYRTMQSRLNAYVAALVCTFDSGPKELPRDVVHEALIKFWARWGEIKKTIPDEAAAHTYLKASCRNLLIDRYRHDRSAQPLLDFLSLKFSHTPEDSMVRARRGEAVRAGGGGGCGELLRSYVQKGLSLAELADREGALPSALYSRWYRCLEKAQVWVEARKPKGLSL